jgi:hypothetical protein
MGDPDWIYGPEDDPVTQDPNELELFDDDYDFEKAVDDAVARYENNLWGSIC